LIEESTAYGKKKLQREAVKKAGAIEPSEATRRSKKKGEEED
jgi:hypothetical protein